MDYHAEARAIAERLRTEGRTGEARSLIDAIETGSTGTEILMALRWHLERIAEAGAVGDAETLQRMRVLAGAIRAALDRA